MVRSATPEDTGRRDYRILVVGGTGTLTDVSSPAPANMATALPDEKGDPGKAHCRDGVGRLTEVHRPSASWAALSDTGGQPDRSMTEYRYVEDDDDRGRYDDQADGANEDWRREQQPDHGSFNATLHERRNTEARHRVGH